MKKYMKAVERRLNLPKDIRARVMSDFESSIRARQEAGQSDEAILAELGDPKKAAGELNEQMREFAYRKSPWRFLFAAVAAYGAAKLIKIMLGQILYWVMRAQVMLTPSTSASVGVIGGADGPTAIFVTAPAVVSHAVPVVLLAVGIFGFLRLCKCTKK